MSETAPAVSVIIPHLNQLDYLEYCLMSLEAQRVALDQYEVIVVDNGSTVALDGIIEARPWVRLLKETKPGPGPARNLGVASSRGDILCFIDADCRAQQDWLRHVLRAATELPSGTIMGGDVRIWRDDPTKPTWIEAYESVFAYRFKLYIERYGFSGTGNLAMRRKDFYKVGPFSGIEIAEDREWGRRARAAGCTIKYIPQMIVYHPARRSLRELFTKWDRHILHDFHSVRQKRLWLAKWLARCAAILLSPVVDIRLVIRSDRICGVSTRVKAAIILFIVRWYRCAKMLSLLFLRADLVWNSKKSPNS